MTVRCLVIGQGSIGTRHARVARALGAEVAVVTGRDDVDARRFARLGDATSFAPTVVIIANETARHRETLAGVGALFPRASVLVEKPLFAADAPAPENTPSRTFVAYCLRFHPAVARLRALVAQRALHAVHAVVGQHLSQWRPDRDHRDSYSARKGEGGVLRDLSHELDLVSLIAGRWRRVVAQTSTAPDLGVASEAMAALLVVAERCSHVTVRLDMIDRAPRRTLLVHAEGMTVEADLVAGTVTANGTTEQAAPPDRDALFARQLGAVLAGDHTALCSIGEARETLRLIDAAERSVATSSWQHHVMEME